MTNVCFIADFFVNQIAGGGELNNEIVIKDLSENGYNVERMNSHSAGLQKLKAMKDVIFINPQKLFFVNQSFIVK